jgi:hypothetical protein
MEEVRSEDVGLTPSLLRQIVDEVDAMNDAEKAELLRKIKLQKALSLAKKADETLEGKFKEMSEEAITDLVSTNRKQRYEQKFGN